MRACGRAHEPPGLRSWRGGTGSGASVVEGGGKAASKAARVRCGSCSASISEARQSSKQRCHVSTSGERWRVGVWRHASAVNKRVDAGVAGVCVYDAMLRSRGG